MNDDEAPATKGYVRGLLEQMEGRLVFQIGDAISQSQRVMLEEFAKMFRAGDDRTLTVADRVTVLERRLDEHIDDRSIHGKRRGTRSR